MRTGGKVAIGLGLVAVLAVGGTAVGLAGKWGDRAVEVVSPANVTKQYDLVTSSWETLVSSADNACSVSKTVAGDGSPTFVEDPAQAYKATFRANVADYNARQANVFEAGLVGPRGYPKHVSTTLGSGDADFCDISAQLTAMRGE